MTWPWEKKRKELEETVRQERGKLAAAVIKNDRVRNRLTSKTHSVGELMTDLFEQLDEAKKRG